MPFCQLVTGPPGAGKTIYCQGMAEFMKSLGRTVFIVNLDPANENCPYEANIDINELIQLEEVMDNLDLGPNGGLMYCMEYLEKKFSSWLEKRFADIPKQACVLIDSPGQVELYTNHSSLKNIFEMLAKKKDFHICVVHLVDSMQCTDSATYISSCLLSLSAMLWLEMPHVNVLSKVDLLVGREVDEDSLDFGLDFYTEVQDLDRLRKSLDANRFSKKFRKLNKALCELISDFSLVEFTTLSIENKKSVLELLTILDKSLGYYLTDEIDTRMTYHSIDDISSYSKKPLDFMMENS